MNLEKISRRRFLTGLSMGLAAASAALVSVPVIGSLLAPLFKRLPEVWRSVGRVESFEVGKTISVVFQNAEPLPWAEGTAKNAAWLRRVSETEFIAFAINCMHLGCPVTWLPDAELFMCPCHGGVYTKDGDVAAGPPPKALARHQVRVRNGEVEILTMPLPIA
jgi:menaquinol-cytochrome c reductase iron-sulfur subunit